MSFGPHFRAGTTTATFLDQNQKPHVWRWLEDEDGYGVAHLVDLRSGALGEAMRQRSFLRSFVLSAPGPKAKICGGTPAVALNTTHRVAFGHVTRNRRYYTVFAYVFEAQSPFRMVACSKEFRFRGLGSESSVDFDVATRPDIEDMIQFPVGLVVDGDQLLVSWGRDRNRETRASSLSLSAGAPAPPRASAKAGSAAHASPTTHPRVRLERA